MRTMFRSHFRTLIAAIAFAAMGFVTANASASGCSTGMHYRASQHFGGMHYRASDSCSQGRVSIRSSCRGPVYVSSYTPYPSGFGHFYRPTIIQPTYFNSSRGVRNSLGGFVQGSPRNINRGPVCHYNGSRGSNLAARRHVDESKRARVHSPTYVPSND